MSTYVCVPPPGSSLPPLEIVAPTTMIARLRLAEDLAFLEPAWRFAAPDYRIVEPEEFDANA